MFFGLLHFHGRPFHGGDYLLLIFLPLNPFLFFFIGRIRFFGFVASVIAQVGLLPKEIFVRKFDAVNRLAKFYTALEAGWKANLGHSWSVGSNYSTYGQSAGEATDSPGSDPTVTSRFQSQFFQFHQPWHKGIKALQCSFYIKTLKYTLWKTLHPICLRGETRSAFSNWCQP